MLNYFVSRFSKKIGIDLGTANTLVYTIDEGIILNQPSIVAVEYQGGQLVPYKFGTDAKLMVGKTPAKYQAIRPMKDGVIADFKLAEAMIRHFVGLVCKVNFITKPTIVICVPSTATSVERRAIQDAAEMAGAHTTYLIDEPMAAALGSNINIEEARGSMIVDIGGGTSEIAVISLGGVVYGNSLRIAGDKMDEAIINYIRKKYNILIGEQTAEKIKHAIGCAVASDANQKMAIKGRDLITGIPKQIEICEQDAEHALKEVVDKIVENVLMALEVTPPEIAADIVETGIVLTGGGALLKNIDKAIAKSTGLTVRIADEPLNCVVKGIGIVLHDIDKYRHIVFREE
jgi:rod shape-determining protein MreB